MERVDWPTGRPTEARLDALCELVARPGIVVVRFVGSEGEGSLTPRALERWTRSRAVTVAEVDAVLAGLALELALSADLVYLREGAVLLLPAPDRPPSAGLVWALARAGRGALTVGLLDGGRLTAERAVALGLAHAVVARGRPLPLPTPCSEVALRAARDLVRTRCGVAAGLALEQATFRLLFASGAPREGARAFLERRSPRFSPPGSPARSIHQGS